MSSMQGIILSAPRDMKRQLRAEFKATKAAMAGETDIAKRVWNLTKEVAALRVQVKEQTDLLRELIDVLARPGHVSDNNGEAQNRLHRFIRNMGE